MKWIYMLCCTLLLAGCSVTIDPANDITEQQDQTQQQTQEQEKEQEKSEQQEKTIFNFLEDILPFPSKEQQELDYLAFGDSLTRGVGDEKDKYGFTGRLTEQLEEWPALSSVELDNRGKNGRRSDQLLNLLESGHYDDELPDADLITITLGGNDVMKIVKSDMFNLQPKMFEQALPGFKERYEKIIAEIREKNADAPIILVGFYNPFSVITNETAAFESILNDWNAVIEQIAKEDTNACFVPVADLFESNEDLVYHTDFFHPNAKGYERITNRVIEYMKLCDIEEMSDGLIGFEE